MGEEDGSRERERRREGGCDRWTVRGKVEGVSQDGRRVYEPYASRATTTWVKERVPEVEVRAATR